MVEDSKQITKLRASYTKRDEQREESLISKKLSKQAKRSSVVKGFIVASLIVRIVF